MADGGGQDTCKKLEGWWVQEDSDACVLSEVATEQSRGRTDCPSLVCHELVLQLLKVCGKHAQAYYKPTLHS
jgi:hypothetical protein